MKTNTFQFKKQPISKVVADALSDVTEFDWHDVFYVGKHTDSAGNTAQWTEKHLDEVVANFQANTVPLVVGHPKTNSPSWGWVSAVRKTDDLRLEIKAESVNPDFAKSVAAKTFPNRSVRFERTSDGVKMVHIGYLGGAAPALDGLPWQFAGNEDETTTVEFSLNVYTQRSFLDMFSRLRDWMIDSMSLEKANEILPDWMISHAREELGQLIDESDPYFSKTPKEPDVSTFTQEQLDAAVQKAVSDAISGVESKFSKQLEDSTKRAEEAEKANAAAAFAQTVKDCQSIVDEQVAAGHLTPANAAGMAQFMAHLKVDEESNFEFAAPDGKSNVTKSAFEFAQNLVKNLGAKSPIGNDQEAIETDNDDLDTKATDYAAKHNVSYADAVTIVSGQ